MQMWYQLFQECFIEYKSSNSKLEVELETRLDELSLRLLSCHIIYRHVQTIA